LQEIEGQIIRSILSVLFAVLVFVFPLFAAWIAYRRKRPGWALATLIGEVFLVGWIVGFFALRQKSPLEMAGREIAEAEGDSEPVKIECPACHSKDVAAVTRIRYRDDGKAAPSRLSTRLKMVFGLILCPILAIVGLVLFFSPTQLYEWSGGRPPLVPAGVTPDQLLALSVLAIAVICGYVGIGARRLRRHYDDRVSTSYDLTCRRCGNTWTVAETKWEPEAE
jgi:MFS family permease